jgi:hypothetical protein
MEKNKKNSEGLTSLIWGAAEKKVSSPLSMGLINYFAAGKK